MVFWRVITDYEGSNHCGKKNYVTCKCIFSAMLQPKDPTHRLTECIEKKETKDTKKKSLKDYLVWCLW